MSHISVLTVNSSEKLLSVEFDISEDLANFFSSEKKFEVEYSEDLHGVPDGILLIPFVCNVLPIVWLTNSELRLPVLDKAFYQSIPDIKRGYVDMSPMLSFQGSVHVETEQENNYVIEEKTAAFFSGGVDAFATLIAHEEEKPTLMTMWGADIKLTDTAGWEVVHKHVNKIVTDFELPPAVLIKSNFRQFVKESELGGLVAASGDGYWHGYQHGIGLIGHAAPIAYLKKLKMVYIASSFTKEDKVICASDPSIDNMVKMGSCRVWHDQYGFSRQKKLTNIVNWVRYSNKYPFLRVCWVTSGGINCGKCEKCIRTIYGLLAEGEQPELYGLGQTYTSFYPKKYMQKHILTAYPYIRLEWKKIQNRFKETRHYINDSKISWIYRINTEAKPNLLHRAARLLKRIARRAIGLFK